MERTYRALRTIATIFKILGWVILAPGIPSACVNSAAVLLLLTSAPRMTGPIARRGEAGLIWRHIGGVGILLGMVVSVGLYTLILIAGAEAIHVVLDIEENTRETARRLALV